MTDPTHTTTPRHVRGGAVVVGLASDADGAQAADAAPTGQASLKIAPMLSVMIAVTS